MTTNPKHTDTAIHAGLVAAGLTKQADPDGIVIKAGRPPNFAAIVKRFPAAIKRGTIFTYGKEIYVTDNKDLPRSLIAHEVVHVDQQAVMGRDAWWDRYLLDKEFRFQMELAAHIMEYATLAQGAGRHERRAGLVKIAKRLSGPLYGNMTTLAKARELIKP